MLWWQWFVQFNMEHNVSKDSYVTVIHPKTIPENSGAENCFLLGPIRNAPPWHEDAVDTLVRLARKEPTTIYLRINCPKRKQDMQRNAFTVTPPSGVHKICVRQREWEFETQESAVHSAGLLFWLPSRGVTSIPKRCMARLLKSSLDTGRRAHLWTSPFVSHLVPTGCTTTSYVRCSTTSSASARTSCPSTPRSSHSAHSRYSGQVSRRYKGR